jgi:hypothetical protein
MSAAEDLITSALLLINFLLDSIHLLSLELRINRELSPVLNFSCSASKSCW